MSIFKKILNKAFAEAIGRKVFTNMVWACWRYRPPLEKAFDRCYLDLERLSSQIHVSYTLLNIIIFIVIYLILLFFDIFFVV